MPWLEKLKVRLLIPILAVLLISMSASFGWLFYMEREQLMNRTSRETSLLGEVVKAALRDQMLKKNKKSTQSTISLITRKSGLKEITLVDKKGVVVYSSNEEAIGISINRESETCAICHKKGAKPNKQTVILRDEAGKRVFRSVNPIENEEECRSCHARDGRLLGILILDQFIGRALLDIRSAQESLFTFGVVTLLVILGLIFIVIDLLVQRPINILIEGTKRIEAGDLDTEISIDVKGEMKELANSFNSMVGSIKEHINEVEGKNFELSTLYSMVEEITRTINLQELRKIVLKIVLEVFAGVEVGVIVFRLAEDGDVELYARKMGEEGIIEKDFAMGAIEEYRNFVNPGLVDQWGSGKLLEPSTTDGGSGMVIPLRAKKRTLGFLYVRKLEGKKFSHREVSLVGALGSHISVSLENARLYSVAITDELTKTFTLRYFQQILEDEIGRYERYGQKMSLLMIDIDDFKMVNDSFGHLVGDAALREFACLVKDSVRDVDVVCRYGGEEFSVILPETEGSAAKIVAERIRKKTEETIFQIEGNEVSLTVSIGISSCPEDSVSVRDLVTSADTALYKAKEMGKNRVVSR